MKLIPAWFACMVPPSPPCCHENGHDDAENRDGEPERLPHGGRGDGRPVLQSLQAFRAHMRTRLQQSETRLMVVVSLRELTDPGVYAIHLGIQPDHRDV